MSKTEFCDISYKMLVTWNNLWKGCYSFGGSDKFIDFPNMGEEDLETNKITHFDLYLQEEFLMMEMKYLLF